MGKQNMAEDWTKYCIRNSLHLNSNLREAFYNQHLFRKHDRDKAKKDFIEHIHRAQDDAENLVEHGCIDSPPGFIPVPGTYPVTPGSEGTESGTEE